MPQPFKDTFTAALPLEWPARTTALNLLKTGSWPSLCPGRRDWASVSVDIPLPIQNARMPSKNWQLITPAQRQPAWQAMAITQSLGDEPTRNFLACDPAVVMDDYIFLALPGSGPTPQATTPADWTMRELQVSTHHNLKYMLEDPRGQRHLPGLTQGLMAGVSKGPMGRHNILAKVNTAAVPLQPLRKEAISTNPKMVPPVKETVPGQCRKVFQPGSCTSVGHIVWFQTLMKILHPCQVGNIVSRWGVPFDLAMALHPASRLGICQIGGREFLQPVRYF